MAERTAKPIWLAEFYENLSLLAPRIGGIKDKTERKKKEQASKRQQQAGMRPLIGRDRGKGKKEKITNKTPPFPFAQWMQPFSVSCVIVTFGKRETIVIRLDGFVKEKLHSPLVTPH